MELNSADVSVPSSEKQLQPPPPPPMPVKKKRNLPGMPDPEAEVIALSPAALLATNRFVCEICNKGFQRDQNLQLHRRGHNLPWKLKQRNGAEVRKRVYVCPEPSCVHHDPSRALGDLTGIKKHFCRKHGEKKWKCDKCSKKYAVMSDWKAHSKTCGTREYRCDCGTLFSRRDSFLTHRAFCDALAEENGKTTTAPLPLRPPPPVSIENQEVETVENCDKGAEAAGKENAPTAVDATPVTINLPPTAVVAAAETTGEEQEEAENSAGLLQHMAAPPLNCMASNSATSSAWTDKSNSNCSSSSSNLFANILSTAVPTTTNHNSTTFSNLGSSISQIDQPHVDSTLLCLSNNGPASLFPPQQHQFISSLPSSSSPYLSATALLQKAAEMGPVRSGSSFLKGFGLDTTLGNQETLEDNSMQWRQDRQQLAPLEPAPLLSAGLGLGLSYEQDTMMGSNLYGAKPATLDFLGLGMGPVVGNANGQISSLMTSINGPQDVGSGSARGLYGGSGSPGRMWESSERKPGSSTIL